MQVIEKTKQNPMKIVHLVTADMYGAGRAALRVSHALQKEGMDSKVCTLFKSNSSDSVQVALSLSKRCRRIFAQKKQTLLLEKYKEHGYYHLTTGGMDLSSEPMIQQADVIHLHWINDGIWSTGFLKSLIKLNKPIVWTLHDMWPFTGGCHYDEFCQKYKNGCGACKVLKSSDRADASAKELAWKKKYFGKLKLQFIGCSQWITEEANKSDVLAGMKNTCITIPNPISTEVFKNYDRNMCRELLGISTKKKIILFGAMSATSDKRKGYEYLSRAIERLDKEAYMLGIFGSNCVEDTFAGFEAKNLGIISDDLHLALLYNAADVFVAPSVQENLANTVMEALACGTPVAAFQIGGMSDMIQHGKNGYLAKPYDITDLANGICRCCEEEALHGVKGMEKFSERVVAQKYIEVYRAMKRG